MNIAVIHGPNLNLLGARTPEHYGTATLEDIDAQLLEVAKELDVDLTAIQSNHEGKLIDFIHSLRGRCAGILINAAGYTHTSVSLRDALEATAIPFVEVHLSNPLAREDFRHESLLSSLALGTISGFGADSYLLGLRALVRAVRDTG